MSGITGYLRLTITGTYPVTLADYLDSEGNPISTLARAAEIDAELSGPELLDFCDDVEVSISIVEFVE